MNKLKNETPSISNKIMNMITSNGLILKLTNYNLNFKIAIEILNIKNLDFFDNYYSNFSNL